MSLIYILGTDKKIDTSKTDLYLEKFENISCYKKLQLNKEFLTEKYYYKLGPEITLGYDIGNIEDFYNNENKMAFEKFLNEVRNVLKLGSTTVALYLFVECDDININENYLYVVQHLSLDINDYPEDRFVFHYNNKYTFE